MEKLTIEGIKSLAIDDNGDYEGIYNIEQILDVKTVDGERQFLVKWEGWEDSENTWEPEEGLQCAVEQIDEFNRRQEGVNGVGVPIADKVSVEGSAGQIVERQVSGTSKFGTEKRSPLNNAVENMIGSENRSEGGNTMDIDQPCVDQDVAMAVPKRFVISLPVCNINSV